MRILLIRVLLILAFLACLPATGFAAASPSRTESASYHSDVMDLDRQILIYLPAAYSSDATARFPVLYLRHGGGDTEKSWIEKGDAPAILDALIAEGRAKPMIVVFTSGTIPDALGSSYDAAGLKAAADELVTEVIPLIESRYRVKKDPAHRAVAGLSMGGGQTISIIMQQPNIFSYAGVFSAGTFGIAGNQAPTPRPSGVKLRPFDPERDFGPAYDDPSAFNHRMKLFYVAVGDKDPRFQPTGDAISLLRARGIKIVSTVQNGTHEWEVWKAALTDFVPRLFQ